MSASLLASFALAYFVFAASPGPDNLQMVARSIAKGPAAGFLYGMGMTTSVLIFLILSALGLSALAEKMGVAMTVLRYAGAAYLIWVGYQTWTADPMIPERASQQPPEGMIAGYLAGLALNLGNPKMPIFYVALLPSFIGNGLSFEQLAALALVIVAVEVVVVSSYVFLALQARRTLNSRAAVRNMNRVTGGVMIGTAVAMASIGKSQ